MELEVNKMESHSKWIHDSWYVIAWDHEIPPTESTEIFTRTVLNEPIIVYRTTDNQLVAMQDRCCHRHAPLSKGKREGDCIRCGYHGLKFNPQGQCIDAPGIAIIPEKARVKTYPLNVKNRWVFVWMGDISKADATLLPDNFSCDHPDWQYKPGYFHYATPYLLICDNLLDFSHLSYVHEKTLGGSTAIAQAVPTIEKTFDTYGKQNGIKVSRQVHNVPAPPFYQKFRSFTENLDRWFIYEFFLPGTLLMHSGGRPTSDAKDDLSRAVQLHSCQTLTPETDSTTHYFFQQSHRKNALDETSAQAMTESIFTSLVGAFNEDRDMITAQHQNIRINPDVQMLPLAMDSALAQFRRLIDSRLNIHG
jgi:phenylpropionate dioxygenase-like ring-hydroxylating dioxygenase large terminal subunit